MMRQHHSPVSTPYAMLALRRNPEWDEGNYFADFFNNHQNKQKYEKNLLPAEIPA